MNIGGIAPADVLFFQSGDLVQPISPILHLPLRLILRDAISFLHATDELVLLAVDNSQVIFSELAPLFLDLAGDLLPVAFDAVPIHHFLHQM
jgi:hypothetical protein